MTLFTADPMPHQHFGRRSMSSMFSPQKPSFTHFIQSLICCLQMFWCLSWCFSSSLQGLFFPLQLLYPKVCYATCAWQDFFTNRSLLWSVDFASDVLQTWQKGNRQNMLTSQVNISLALIKKVEINIALFAFLNAK